MLFENVIQPTQIADDNEIKDELFLIMEHTYEYMLEIKDLKQISFDVLIAGFQNWIPEISEHMTIKLKRAKAYARENYEIMPYPIILFLSLGLDKTTKEKCFNGIANLTKGMKDKCLKLLKNCVNATLYLTEEDLSEENWNVFSSSGYDFLKILE
jgi:hypothetical protein